MNICDHFKLVIASGAGLVVGKFVPHSVLVFAVVAVAYAVYSHKDAIKALFVKKPAEVTPPTTPPSA